LKPFKYRNSEDMEFLDFDRGKVVEFFRTNPYCGAEIRARTPCKRKDIYYPLGR